MSTTQRGVRAVGCLPTTVSGAVCLAWHAQAGAPVPRVLGFRLASRLVRRKFKVIDVGIACRRQVPARKGVGRIFNHVQPVSADGAAPAP